MVSWLTLFLLAFCVQYTCSWVFKKYPYADLTMEEKIISDGYPLEIHEVTTDDNYILTLHRIPHGRSSGNSTNRSPVLLLHGMGGTAEMYVVLGKDRALPYNLADGGFDVWFMSARGTYGSRSHKYYNLDVDKEYWNYGFHEIAIYDIPATIDYITMKTHQKIFVIGHSQGNTCYFITTMEKEEYKNKIKMAVAYGPTIFLYYTDFSIIILLSHIVELIQNIFELINFQEMPLLGYFSSLGKRICKEQTFVLDFCTHIMSAIGTHPSKIMDRDLVPVASSAPLPRLSTIQFFHYMQVIKSGRFQKYDHGVKKNLQIYGNETPPLYDLKKSTPPVALFFAPKDDYITVEGAEETIKALPNVIFYHFVDYKYFTHLDFLFGRNASALVYQKTVQLFKDFDNGILSMNETNGIYRNKNMES